MREAALPDCSQGAAVSAKSHRQTPAQALLADRVGVEILRARHLDLADAVIETHDGTISVTIDASESPLAWLARRKGRDGRPMIEPVQFQAGERLRTDFTRAHLMPRITANWSAAVADGRRGVNPAHFTESMLAARQRVQQALDAASPEFSGLLVDVCCFLKSPAQVESERGWPLRSAKVVLQLGLDRLARHYGLTRVARGKSNAEVRTWLAEDASFTLGFGE